MRKQEAIHRLLSLELDFIDLMHAGMQSYSRPLRHCVLSHTQHTALFQNIEKVSYFYILIAIKPFCSSFQLSMKFFLLINVKAGILTFISRIND